MAENAFASMIKNYQNDNHQDDNNKVTPNTVESQETKINVNEHIVPIFQQNGWTKVGNPQNGDVGWVNNDEFTNKPFANRAQPYFSSTIVTSQTDNNGHTSYRLIQNDRRCHLPD